MNIKYLTAAGGVIAALWLSAAPVLAQETVVRMTVQQASPVTALIDIAITQGYFKDLGIKAEPISVANGPAAVTALASGSVDIATNAPEVFLALVDKGGELKLISGATKQLTVLVASPKVAQSAQFPTSIQSLRGKKIGVTALNSATQYLTTMILDAAGLKSSDVQFIAVGTGAPQALANGIVDAAIVTGPQVMMAERQGAKILLDLRQPGSCPEGLKICGIGHIGTWTTKAWIEKNPKALAGVRAAIARADQFLHDPAQHEAALKAISTLIPADTPEDEKQRFFTDTLNTLSAVYSEQDLKTWISVDRAAGVISGDIDVQKVFDPGTAVDAASVAKLAQAAK